MSSPGLHPLLTRAKSLCESFRVRPYAKGFIVWRFHDWEHELAGWRRIATASTRTDAEALILARFDLAEPDEPKPVEPKFVTFQTQAYDLGDTT